MKQINFIIIMLVVLLFSACSSTTNNNVINENQNAPVTDEIQEEGNEEPTPLNELEIVKAEDSIQVEEMNKDGPLTLEDEKTMTLFDNSYREFNMEEYNLAIHSDYYLVLDFYSNWCPSCKKEDSILQSSFNDLENIVIFKVNHEDSDTSQDEKELALKFDISKRDSGIVLKKGVEISRYNGHKSQSEYEAIFNSLQ